MYVKKQSLSVLSKLPGTSAGTLPAYTSNVCGICAKIAGIPQSRCLAEALGEGREGRREEGREGGEEKGNLSELDKGERYDSSVVVTHTTTPTTMFLSLTSHHTAVTHTVEKPPNKILHKHFTGSIVIHKMYSLEDRRGIERGKGQRREGGREERKRERGKGRGGRVGKGKRQERERKRVEGEGGRGAHQGRLQMGGVEGMRLVFLSSASTSPPARLHR